MCEGNMSISSKNKGNCDSKFKKELLSKEELLTRLKKHKKNLESELSMVNSKLGSEDTNKKGGE